MASRRKIPTYAAALEPKRTIEGDRDRKDRQFQHGSKEYSDPLETNCVFIAGTHSSSRGRVVVLCCVLSNRKSTLITGTIVSGTFHCCKNPNNSRELDVEIHYSVKKSNDEIVQEVIVQMFKVR